MMLYVFEILVGRSVERSREDLRKSSTRTNIINVSDMIMIYVFVYLRKKKKKIVYSITKILLSNIDMKEIKWKLDQLINKLFIIDFILLFELIIIVYFNIYNLVSGC